MRKNKDKKYNCKKICDHIYEEIRGNSICYKTVYQGKTKRFTNEKDARRHVAQLTIEDTSYDECNKESFYFSYVAQGLIKYLRKERKFSTYKTKKDIIEKIIIPMFPDKEFGKITKLDCNDMRERIGDLEFSTQYKNNILTIFKQIFNYAEDKYDLDNKYARKLKKFPLTDEEKISAEENNNNVWTPEDFGKFINQIKPLSYRTLFTLLISAWTRIGETTALRWSYYDGESIHVYRNIVKVPNTVNDKCFIDVTVKTQKGNRYIKLPKQTCELLDELKERQKQIPGFNDEWYIFNRWDGKKYLDGTIPIPRTNITRVFDIGIEKAKIKRIRIHDLRHSGATHAIVSGEDIKAVSERLGHEDIETTLRVYHHAIDKTKVKLMSNTEDFASLAHSCPQQ